MREVFLTILRMGLVSSYVILVVLLVRRLLSRFPKRYSYLLWSVVFLRLACPVGIESSFSLVPDALFAKESSAVGGNAMGMHDAAVLLARQAGSAQNGDSQMWDSQTGNRQAGDSQAGNLQAGDSQTGNPQAGNAGLGNAQVGNDQIGNSQTGNPQIGNAQVGKEGDKRDVMGDDGIRLSMTGEGHGNSGIADAGMESDKFGELEGAASGNNAGELGIYVGGQGENADIPGRNGVLAGFNIAGNVRETVKAENVSGIITDTSKSKDASGITKDTAKTEGVDNDQNMPSAEENAPSAKWLSTGMRTGIPTLLCIVWLAGILVFWTVWARSIRRFQKKLLGAVRVEEGVYETGQVAASFVDGVFRPVIYIAAGLSGQARKYVLCHERVHVRRRDPLIKAVALFLVSIYWFHPLVWLAFKKMCEDMEMSCDERVVELLGAEIKKEYSSTLLQMAQNADEVSLLAAFGGNEVKSRVKNVLSYRKPKKWLAILLLMVVAALGIGLGLNPGGRDAEASGSVQSGNTEGEGGNADGQGQDGKDTPGGQDGQNDEGTLDGRGGQDDKGALGSQGGQDDEGTLGGQDGQKDAGTPGSQDRQDGMDAPDGRNDVNTPGTDGNGQSGENNNNLSNPDSQVGGNENFSNQNGTKSDSPTAKYASVLHQYYLALEEKWEPEELNRTGLSVLARYCYDGNALENVGFAFLDLNGDGEEELLIGAIAGDPFVERQIFQAYTIKDGEPWGIFSGRERNRYYLCKEEDGSYVIVNEGSLGAGNSEWYYYRLLQDGTLSTIWKIVDDFEGTVINGGNTGTGKLLDAMEEEGETIIKAYEAKYMKVEYSPFSDFDAQELNAWEDAWKVRGTALEAQLNLILSKKELWEEEDSLYTVADLDQNGRLELISASRQGTGIYTYSHIYEVSEDGAALVLCARTLMEEYDSQADIITSFTPVYKNPQTGQKNYIFLDLLRDGVAYSYESQWTWQLQDGYLAERCLASMETVYEDADTAKVTYASGEFGNVRVTNLEEYMGAADGAFAGWQKGTARFWWFDPEEEARMQRSWYDCLEDSYDGFFIRMERTKVTRPQEEIEREVWEEWKEKAEKQGVSEQEAAEWYARFIGAGMVIKEDDGFSEICFGDFDKNGITDCFFALNRDVKMDNIVWNRKTGTEYWGSMNGETFWHKEFQCWDVDRIIAVSVVAGDIDHDGYTELLLGGDTGGLGTGARMVGQMLQYREGKIVERTLPSDDGGKRTGGYLVSVYETSKTKTCRAVLSQDGREVRFTVTGSREYAPFLDEEMPGWRDGNEPFGGAGYGYHSFEVVTQEGKDYLLAKERLYPRAGYGQIGFACFLFDWDENGGAYVKDFYVEPF